VTVPILGSAKTAYVDGSRLLWALPSLVHGRFGYRAIAPDRIQGDAVLLPHTSHTAQSRFAFDYSSHVGGIPDHSPSPPDLWWSIGAGLWSGIPPPNSQRLLTTQTPYKDGWSEAIPIMFATTVMGFAKAQPILVIAKSVIFGRSERNSLPQSADRGRPLAIGSYPS
jgi:hypothetical protein